MFIGHYAPAFAAAGVRGGPSLPAMFVAAQLVDYALFAFVLTGTEHMRVTPGLTAMNPGDFYDMPYTHSLIGALGFAAAWAIGARVLRREWRTAWIGAAVVASHWLLDLLVHAPDLTILGHGHRYGFALWDRPQVAMPLELALVAVAAMFWLSRTRARSPVGRIAAAVLLLALVAVQLADWLRTKPLERLDPAPVTLPLAALAIYTVLVLLARWAQATRVNMA